MPGHGVEKGPLCKAIGISNFTIKKTKDVLETAKIMPACNQGMSVTTTVVYFALIFICLSSALLLLSATMRSSSSESKRYTLPL